MSASNPENLKGLASWLPRNGSVWQAGTGLIAIFYGTMMISIPPGKLSLFVGLALGSVVVLVPFGALRAQQRLKTLRRLGDRSGKPSTEDLSTALREVAALPDFLFWSALLNWVIGSLFVGLAVKVLGEMGSWALSFRIVLLGMLFGPLACVGGMLLATLRGRVALVKIAAEGLTPAQVFAALPPKRAQLRARLVAFTAIVVLSPVVTTYDVATSLTHASLARVVEVRDPTSQRAIAQAERTEALVKICLIIGLVFALSMFAAHASGSALGAPMRHIAAEATMIAEGKVREVKVIPAEDELWGVSSAFTGMQVSLSGVLSQLKAAGLRIGTTTEQMVATSAKYEAGASNQASSLNETSATTEELARSAKQISENAASVESSAQRTLDAAQGGKESAAAFASSLGRMRQDNEAIVQAVLKLNKRVQQIGKIVEFINNVADRSDLLALNADLEGAKAGEVGRGFSLVAAEMRRLAENVIESTKEIEGLIEEIRDATRATVVATEAGLAATLGGGDLASAISSTLEMVVDLAGKTSDAVRSIALSTQQQQQGTDQLASAMADILRVTQQNLDTTRQVTAANADLTALSRDLRLVVDRFQIEG